MFNFLADNVPNELQLRSQVLNYISVALAKKSQHSPAGVSGTVPPLCIVVCFYSNVCSLCVTQELKWSLSPQTPISWLNVYMQVAYLQETDQLLIPKYPQTTFSQIAEVCVHVRLPR